MKKAKPNKSLASAGASLPVPNREVVMKDPTQLKPYRHNARTHSKKQIEQIASCMRLTGFLGSILVDTNGVIIAGHGRLEAALLLGLHEVPVTYVTHLDDKEVRALRVADNRLAELAGWSHDALRFEFAELMELELDFDLEVTGFEHAEIDLLIDGDGQSTAGDPDDTVEDPAKTAVSQIGDIWLLGPHRLMCGSMLDQVAAASLMNGALASMVFTDPPYNVPVAGHVCGLGRIQHREFGMASGEMTEEQFTRFLTDALLNLAFGVTEGGILFVCMDWRHLGELLTAARATDLQTINLCVWNKSNGGMGSLYRSKHELVLVLKKGATPHINNIQLGRFGRYRTNVWDYAGVNSFGRDRMEELASHPTVKPIALVADAIRDVSHRNNIIIDGFMGSGTTLLAAERTGRVAYGMEVDPLYVDLAIRRWEKLSGRDARLEETGETFAELAERRDPVDMEGEADRARG